ncbi:MAG: response regulator [Ekhidna sp.]|uniref:hybrid sensor histidine kinase/response regulator n=1 Tax=Ekhidna sp. TaxID=2608089 RepID=UPI0032EF205A
MDNKKQPIRILYLEDNEDDVDLLRITLKKSDIFHELDFVSSKQSFFDLKLSDYDLIITDYNLKDYDGLSAIKYIRTLDEAVPIILLSGTVGEELAADLLRAGANDFVLKSNIKKITIAIERVIKETSMTREKQRFQRELLEKNLILDTIFDSFEDLIFLKDANGRYRKVNKAFCEFIKMHEAELVGHTDTELFTGKIAEQSKEQDEYVKLSGKPVTYEVEMTIDNQRKVLEATKTPLIIDDEVTGIVGKFHDITTRKILLDETMKAKSILSQAEKLTRSGSFEYDAELDLISCSSNLKHILRLQIAGDTISFRKLTQLVKEEDRGLFVEGISKAIENYEEYHNEHRFRVEMGEKCFIYYFKVVLRPDYKDKKGKRFYGTIVDVTSEHDNQIYQLERQERDRKEIARELHDNLGQKMNAISMFISKISDNIPDNKDLLKVRNLAHESIDDLGYLINTISVKQIEEHSLGYAIDKLIGYMPEDILINRKYNINEKVLSPFVRAQIYRIVQEALNNIVKYSKASEVQLSLLQEGGVLSLKIDDNGKGFSKEKVLTGNGLQNIIHRVRRSNGLVDIDSKIGEGTRINVKVPVS